MRTLISFAALLASIALLQLSSGGVGPLDALSGLVLGFTPAQIGLLGSAHFVGFFVGCWQAPRIMGAVGHSRAFAAFTATGAIGLLAHVLITDPYAWALMRVASGVSVAGCYTVVESWLQAKVTNTSRGRVMGGYRGVDLGAALVAQLMIAVLEPASYISYNVLALICCASLLPLALTRSQEPVIDAAPRLRPGLAWRISPLSVAGVMVAGLTGSAFRMVGPLYGREIGLDAREIAWFLGAYILGGAIAQWPAGWFADNFDRRKVLITLSLLAAVAGCATVAAPAGGTAVVLIAAIVFGIVTYPVYSVAAAHAHDFAEPDKRVELSAALLFFYALGAIASPLVASSLVGAFGPGTLFVLVSLGHLALVVYGLLRMRVRPATETRTAYVYAPRTSFLIGRLIGRLRDRGDRDGPGA
ncbi:MFS transporter [Psychromarinibacter sp. S121]|uniref:MFS transporter n=1 Tax=Psychromarinibacter sp. S121 TaxID=3415127 RepID=UPI003C7A371E